MSRFEDNLWAQLERDHGPTLVKNVATHRRMNAGRWLAAAAVAAVLGSGAVVAPSYFGGTPPAYAVVDNPDGTVTVKIWDLTKFEEVTAKLREHGIPAVALQEREDCQAEGRLVDPARYNTVGLVDHRTVGDETLMTITRDRIPAGTTLGLALRDLKVPATHGSSIKVIHVMLYERDRTPSCLRSLPALLPGPPS